MADGYNRVFLLGGLGADPELRHTQSGQPVLNMRLATTESYLNKDKERVERTDWHVLVLFGQRAESLSKHLVKGSQIFVEGKLQTSSYDDRDGNKRYKTEVIVNELRFAGGKRADNAGDDSGDAGDGGSPQGNGGRSQSQQGGNGGRGGQSQGKPSGGSYGRQQGASNGNGGGQRAPQQRQAAPPADDFGYDGGDDVPF